MGTGRAFHKAGPAMEKDIDPVLVFIWGTKNVFKFVKRRYFEHSGRKSKSVRYAGWLSFRVREVITTLITRLWILYQRDIDPFSTS